MVGVAFYVVLGLVAALASATLSPVSGWLGRTWGLVDKPGGRRQHRGIVPRTGGLALWASFTLVLGLYLAVREAAGPELRAWLPVSHDPLENRRIWALLGGSAFCAAWGIIDDRFDLASRWQYLIQIGAGLIAMAGLIFIKHVNNPLGPGLIFGPDGFPWWLVLAVTVFWFMGCINTVNWLDGLSGLAAGVSAILCAVLVVHMLFVLPEPQASVAVIPAILLGVIVGFLPANLWRRSLFMGSSGSYFLGNAVAAVGIMGGAKIATVMMVLGLPIVDVAWLIFSRLRRGVAPWTSGRDHLHFVLLDRGVPERAIVFAYYLFCCIFGALTLLLDDRINKLLALLALGLGAVIVMAWLGRDYSAPKQSPDRQNPAGRD